MSKIPPYSALQVMLDAPVIPVIVLNDIAHAVPMARALVAGGIRMLEVTLRTPQALACIEAIAKEVPEAIVGAGTVRTKADAQAAAMAGAQFAVSPGYTAAVGMNRVRTSGRVITFEPVPRYCAMIRALAEANPGHRLQVEAAALGERAAEAEIAVSAANIGWNTMVPGFMHEDHEVVRVPVLVFDDYARTHGLERIDLIKIDVEGYELPVLAGMRETLLRLLPMVHLECAPQAYALLGRRAIDLTIFLTEVGYLAYDAQSLRPVDPAAVQGTTNLLLSPVGR